MKAFTGFFLILFFVSFCIVATLNWYDFKVNCGDYLKLTGDAPNIELADKYLSKAIQYLEDKNMTAGNSAILFRTPDCDVGIWYNNLKGAETTLKNIIKFGGTQLEKDNALMKIREVVLDAGEQGTKVTKPSNITWFPNQGFMCLWLIISLIGLVIIFVFIGLWVNN